MDAIKLSERDLRSIVAILLWEKPIAAMRIAPGTRERFGEHDIMAYSDPENEGYLIIEPIDGDEEVCEPTDPLLPDDEMPNLRGEL